MSDAVNHPVHYTSHPSGIEWLAVARLMPFTTGNAVKYIWCATLKNGIEDLAKARFYLVDHLANGLPRHPPFKARGLLQDVIAAEPDENRRRLFKALAYGDVEGAIELLGELVGVGAM